MRLSRGRPRAVIPESREALREAFAPCVYWSGPGIRAVSYETHLPAKEAQARTRPRVSRSYAYARGALDAEAAAR
jgi:hypothetical protein